MKRISNYIRHLLQVLFDVTAEQPPSEATGVFAELELAIKEFNRSAWEKGLRKQVENEPHARGMSCLFSGGELWTFVLAGRVMITLTDSGHSISVMAAEKGPSRMGLHTTNGTTHQAINLLRQATAAWKQGSLILKPDSNLTIG